jgi:hypothetical protein
MCLINYVTSIVTWLFEPLACKILLFANHYIRGYVTTSIALRIDTFNIDNVGQSLLYCFSRCGLKSMLSPNNFASRFP